MSTRTTMSILLNSPPVASHPFPCHVARRLPAVLTALLLLAGRAGAHDTLLTNVPMQGPMIHVGFEYHAAHQALHVHLDPGVPALTPLALSHPDAMFAADAPWRAYLDPHTLGWAFNRQYGFVVGGDSDPLPAGSAIWIRQISATPGLQVFRYRPAGPATWAPMFGSDGSTNVFEWSLTMFHPAYACPPDGGPHEAAYEAFLVNPATGEPVAGVVPAAFTLKWTVAGQATGPELAIAHKVALTWAADGTNHVVQWSPAATGAPWTTLTNTPGVLDGRLTILVAPDKEAGFFRLAPMDGGHHRGH
ncbi:MAG: hypothetical protein ACKVYV_09220 [Limisphaerales bacterium]